MATKVNPPIEPQGKVNTKLANSQPGGETRELLEPVHLSKWSRFGIKFLYASLVLIALAFALFLKWSFADENVLQVNNEPFPVRTIREHPSSNGVVILKVDFCKNTDVNGDLRLSFVSKDREVFLPITQERTPKGCQNTEFPIIIPSNIEPGTYVIKFRVTYDLNPLKKGIVDEFQSKEFTVEPEDVRATE